MSLRSSISISATCACWLLLALVTSARADETTGRWTGLLEGRANYYWERSTRVIVPAAKVSLESPDGIRMNVNYLVDVIASASIAQTGGGKDGVFTELRHGIGAGVGKTFALGDNELDLNLHGTYSTEDDYKSWLFGADGAYSWNDKDSSLLFGVTGVDDTVLSNADRTFRGKLRGVTLSTGLSQVLSPVLTLGLGYQLVYLDGYLGNPYRRALIGPLPHPEDPPDHRLRHNLQGQVSWFLPATQTTLQAYARLYLDSWDMFAVTPELRVYQQLTQSWTLRLRYRYYKQTGADFALKPGQTRYPTGYTGPLTDDPKLSAFDSQQIGVRTELALAALSGTFLDFLSRGLIDFSLDYQWCTSSFGNNVIGTLGGQLPF
jgi:opacity protein-like surface antigen